MVSYENWPAIVLRSLARLPAAAASTGWYRAGIFVR